MGKLEEMMCFLSGRGKGEIQYPIDSENLDLKELEKKLSEFQKFGANEIAEGRPTSDINRLIKLVQDGKDQLAQMMLKTTVGANFVRWLQLSLQHRETQRTYLRQLQDQEQFEKDVRVHATRHCSTFDHLPRCKCREDEHEEAQGSEDELRRQVSHSWAKDLPDHRHHEPVCV